MFMHDEHPWYFRATSLFVVFTFIFTQSDIGLAFSSLAPQAPLEEAVSVDELEKQKERCPNRGTPEMERPVCRLVKRVDKLLITAQ